MAFPFLRIVFWCRWSRSGSMAMKGNDSFGDMTWTVSAWKFLENINHATTTYINSNCYLCKYWLHNLCEFPFRGLRACVARYYGDIQILKKHLNFVVQYEKYCVITATLFPSGYLILCANRLRVIIRWRCRLLRHGWEGGNPVSFEFELSQLVNRIVQHRW